MIIIIGSKNNNALVLDTSDMVVEQCSWDECENYVSHGFNIIGFNNSYRMVTGKNGNTKYVMKYDLKTHISPVKSDSRCTKIVLNPFMEYYRKINGVRISGELCDGVGDSSFSLYNGYVRDKRFIFYKLSNLSYMRRIVFDDMFLNMLFITNSNLEKTYNSYDDSVNILSRYLTDNKSISIDGLNYNNNLVPYFRYIYGVLNNIPMFTKNSPEIELFNETFFRVDMDEISKWKVFEYKSYIYFCEDDFCVFISKEDLVSKGEDVNKSKISMMKSKLSSGISGDFTVNPKDGSIIVKNAELLTIDEGMKYTIIGNSFIDKLIICTDKPDITIKRDTRIQTYTSSLVAYNTIECNCKSFDISLDFLKSLNIDGEVNLFVDISIFDNYFKDTSSMYSLKTIKFTGISDEDFEKFILDRLNEIEVLDNYKKGFITSNQHNFLYKLKRLCLNIENIPKLGIINEMLSANSFYSIYSSMTIDGIDMSGLDVYNLCRNYRNYEGIRFTNYTDSIKEIEPDFSKLLYLNNYHNLDLMKETAYNFTINLYRETYVKADEVETDCLKILKEKYNVPAWLIVTYTNRVPDYKEIIWKDCDELFKEDIKKKRWKENTDTVIQLIKRVIRVKLFKRGTRAV